MKYGGPAFPTPDIGGHIGSDGMSLRDYFAAAVLQGMWAGGHTNSSLHDIELGKICYASADAMLEARNNKQEAK